MNRLEYHTFGVWNYPTSGLFIRIVSVLWKNRHNLFTMLPSPSTFTSAVNCLGRWCWKDYKSLLPSCELLKASLCQSQTEFSGKENTLSDFWNNAFAVSKSIITDFEMPLQGSSLLFSLIFQMFTSSVRLCLWYKLHGWSCTSDCYIDSLDGCFAAHIKLEPCLMRRRSFVLVFELLGVWICRLCKLHDFFCVHFNIFHI